MCTSLYDVYCFYQQRVVWTQCHAGLNIDKLWNE